MSGVRSWDRFAEGLPDPQEAPVAADREERGGEIYRYEEVYDTQVGLFHKECLADYCRRLGLEEDDLDPVVIQADDEAPAWADYSPSSRVLWHPTAARAAAPPSRARTIPTK